MKKLLLMSLLLVSAQSYATSNNSPAKLFKVTITNLTKGQPLTPAVVAVHAPGYQLFELGAHASDGLSALATDGKTDAFVHELNESQLVQRNAVGKGVILPGKSETLMVEANDYRYNFSVVAMLARTNDAIMSAMNLTTHLQLGQSYTSLARVYDAGVEVNTESCSDIPAPPCKNPGQGTKESNGFITPHQGLLNIGDLNPARDAFASLVAKITVERIQ